LVFALTVLSLLTFGQHAFAEIIPPGCTFNGVFISLGVDKQNAHVGETISYSAVVGNAPTMTDVTQTRFVPKGLRSHRARLGLSADEYGRLVGVSAQTIYSWEGETSTPRAAQRASLAAVRGLGKREAHARLEAVTSAGRKKTRRTGR
jgi:uncharacterized repeat protein (TIGR01451 family)